MDLLNQIDIRVGTIETVEDIAGSEKLVVLTVEFGDHQRMIVAGLKQERANPKEIEGKQALFVVLGLVIMIVKNGIRIATLTILAQYVDSSFLFGRLHHEGGIVFFVIGLLLLLPVFWLLQRGETAATAPAGSGNGAAAI